MVYFLQLIDFQYFAYFQFSFYDWSSGVVKKNFFINLLVCNLFVYLHSENKPKDSYKLSSFLTYQITNEAMGIYILYNLTFK